MQSGHTCEVLCLRAQSCDADGGGDDAVADDDDPDDYDDDDDDDGDDDVDDADDHDHVDEGKCKFQKQHLIARGETKANRCICVAPPWTVSVAERLRLSVCVSACVHAWL